MTDSQIAAHRKRAPRYLGVGFLCLAINNALLILLDEVGIHYGISVLISAAVMVPLGFLLQSRFTFAVQRNWAAFFRYTAAMSVNTPLAYLILWAIHERAGMPMLYASPLMTGILLIWNYLASGWAILARRTRMA